MDFQQFINQKKESYQLLLDFIEDKIIDEKELKNYLNNLKNNGSKDEILEFFRLISNICNYHHRDNSFITKIQQIFISFSEILKRTMSNTEIFDFFMRNKRIIFFLIKNQIIDVDSEIFAKIKQAGHSYCRFFYPQIKKFLTSADIDNIEKVLKYFDSSILTNFEEKQNEGENESFICTLIRNDDIVEFIKYIHKNNIQIESIIYESIFETNEMLVDKAPTLIEYAAFFGSIQIFNYLKSNGASIDGYARTFSICSNNAEVYTQIEEIQNLFTCPRLVMIDFIEAVMCHHNEIAEYIRLNLPENYILDERTIADFIGYYNYTFFLDEIDHPMAFYYLYINGHMTIVDAIAKKVGQEIDIEISNERDSNNDNENASNTENASTNNNDNDNNSNSNNDNENTANTANADNTANNDNAANNDNTGVIRRFLGKVVDFFSKRDDDENVTENIEHEEDFEHEEDIDSTDDSSKITELLQNAANENDDIRLYSLLLRLKCIKRSYFQYNKKLNVLIIPPTITRIERCAFKECSSLQTIIIPPIESIEDHTFCGCSSLTSINIPSTVTKLGDYAFQGCEKLTHITAPPSVNYIGKCCFGLCSELTEFIIPPLVTEIKQKTFCFCESLTRVTIPPSVTIIDNFSFERCDRLTEIDIPSSVTTIKPTAFSGCQIKKRRY